MLETRQTAILEELERKGNVEVKKLSRMLNVTEKTIRLDLIRMEKDGLLKRVHGGAVVNIRDAEDVISNPLRIANISCKEAIAKAAYDYIRTLDESSPVIYIDAGTTTFEFARLLKNFPNLTVITNDLLVAAKLSNYDGHLSVTGGVLSNNVNRYLTGSDTVDTIRKHPTSLCLIGASSLDVETGLYTHTDNDASVKKAAMSMSRKVVCLADHTKFNKISFVRFADMSEIDVIITDHQTPKEQIRLLEEKGIEVIVAGNSDHSD